MFNKMFNKMAKYIDYKGQHFKLEDVPKSLIKFLRGLEKVVSDEEGKLIVHKTNKTKGNFNKLEISSFNRGKSARIKIIHPPFECVLDIREISSRNQYNALENYLKNYTEGDKDNITLFIH